MNTAQQVREYFDIMARALRVIEDYPESKKGIYSLKDFNNCYNETKAFLSSVFALNCSDFLEKITVLIDDIENSAGEEKFIIALALCIFLDQRISYLDSCVNSFSVFSLISVYSNNPVVLKEPLNSNYKETFICINPKLPVGLLYEYDENQEVYNTEYQLQEEGRRLFNRDGYTGINGELKKISYYKWDNSFTVTNIVVPNDFLAKNPSNFKIAFSPLSNRNDLLKIDNNVFERKGQKHDGEYIKELKYQDELLRAFCGAWLQASRDRANIFFVPEMLCTESMSIVENGYNTLIREMALDQLSKGEPVPDITVMPSYWRDGRNSCQILYQDGELLGEQFKFYPYVDQKNNQMESLVDIEKKEIIIIHISEVHRIVIMICSDFLTEQESWLENTICKQLLPTLIIVPSFSHGEQDFINSLTVTKRYGASIVWGNCCGAKTIGDSQIGGCGIVGIDNIVLFKDYNECGFVCAGEHDCAFTIEIPLRILKNHADDIIKVNHVFDIDKE